MPALDHPRPRPAATHLFHHQPEGRLFCVNQTRSSCTQKVQQIDRAGRVAVVENKKRSTQTPHSMPRTDSLMRVRSVGVLHSTLPLAAPRRHRATRARVLWTQSSSNTQCVGSRLSDRASNYCTAEERASGQGWGILHVTQRQIVLCCAVGSVEGLRLPFCLAVHSCGVLLSR